MANVVIGYTSFEEPAATNNSRRTPYLDTLDVSSDHWLPENLARGSHPVSYVACSHGHYELGFRTFWTAQGRWSGGVGSTAIHIGVIGDTTTAMLGDGGHGGVAPHGSQYFKMAGMVGFTWMELDQVHVAAYANATARCWVRVEAAAPWASGDIAKVWVTENSTTGTEIKVFDIIGSPPVYASNHSIRVATDTWKEYQVSLSGHGLTTATLRFGLKASGQAHVLIDHIQITGVGVDRSRYLCGGWVCPPGTQRSGYVAGMALRPGGPELAYNCSACPAGRATVTPGAPCAACPAGTFSANISGATSCDVCANQQSVHGSTQQASVSPDNCNVIAFTSFEAPIVPGAGNGMGVVFSVESSGFLNSEFNTLWEYAGVFGGHPRYSTKTGGYNMLYEASGGKWTVDNNFNTSDGISASVEYPGPVLGFPSTWKEMWGGSWVERTVTLQTGKVSPYFDQIPGHRDHQLQQAGGQIPILWEPCGVNGFVELGFRTFYQSFATTHNSESSSSTGGMTGEYSSIRTIEWCTQHGCNHGDM
jgi:hypothetical protein